MFSREEPEGRAKSRTFGFVSELTVLRLPVDQRAGGLGQAEQRATELIPARTEIVLLDLRERRALGRVIRIEAAALMPIPAPRRTLDPVRVEYAKIGGEAIELLLIGTVASGHTRNANPFRP